MRYVGLEHIEPQTMKLLGHGHASEVRSSSLRFSKGDVLYGKMRPYLNKVWIAEFDGLCSGEFLVLQTPYGVNTKFLAFRVNATDFVAFANQQVSGERPRVDFDKLSRFPILLPPFAEQERIAAKLNAALSRVERAERAARRARERLERYRVAVFNAAASGELTRDWRNAQRKGKGASHESAKVLLEHLLVARRSRWEEAVLTRLSSGGRVPKDDKWKSRYPDPAPPITNGLDELPDGWTGPRWISSA